jgi:phage RecT family recombinase
MENQISTKVIETGLTGYKDQLDKIIDKAKLIKEIGFAAQAVNSNSKLMQCSQVSIFKAVYNVALTGLSLNPITKQSAMVPKYINGEWQAVLFPMYQGLVKLLTDTGSVISCTTNLVYDGDEFEVELGMEQKVTHKPKFKSKNITFAYAIGKLADGSTIMEVMDREDLDYIRSLSETYKAYEAGKLKPEHVIWINFEGEMYRKTVLKRLCKYLPKTEQWNRVHEAIAIDNEEYTISYDQQSYLLALIDTSSHDDDLKSILERKVLGGLNPNEFNAMKGDLIENQINPVTEAASYNQGQLKKHLSNIGHDNRRKPSNELFKDENEQ